MSRNNVSLALDEENGTVSLLLDGQVFQTIDLASFTQKRPNIPTEVPLSDPAQEKTIFYSKMEGEYLSIVFGFKGKYYVGWGLPEWIYRRMVKADTYATKIELNEARLTLQIKGYIYNPFGLELDHAMIDIDSKSSMKIDLPVSKEKMRRRKFLFTKAAEVSFPVVELMAGDYELKLRSRAGVQVNGVQVFWPVGYGFIKRRGGWKFWAPQQVVHVQDRIFYLHRSRKGHLLVIQYETQDLSPERQERLQRNTFWNHVKFSVKAFFRGINRRLVRWTKNHFEAVSKCIPVKKNLVLFVSFHGRGYSDNPRAIYEAMRQDPRFQNCTYVWAIKKHKEKNLDIPGAKIIEYYSLPYFWNLARARFWIFNCKMAEYVYKKPDQYYLQTWHGTPLKRLGKDIDIASDATFYRSGMSFEEMCRSYDVDSAKYNWMVSPNAFCTEVFPSAFGVKPEQLVETGYPRNDFLSNYAPEDVERIKARYNIPEGKKILLYAPTWRDNSFVSSGYTFELQADFHKWKEILGDDYVVLFKPHYLIINKYEDDPELEDFLISIPANDDIRDLYIISDEMITDYSSVFFDYGILERPVYFYMYDLADYASNLRGFYMDITKELPGPIFEDETEMLEAIAKGDFDYSRYPRFNARYNNKEDGKASQRILDLLAEKLDK